MNLISVKAPSKQVDKLVILVSLGNSDLEDEAFRALKNWPYLLWDGMSYIYILYSFSVSSFLRSLLVNIGDILNFGGFFFTKLEIKQKLEYHLSISGQFSWTRHGVGGKCPSTRPSSWDHY